MNNTKNNCYGCNERLNRMWYPCFTTAENACSPKFDARKMDWLCGVCFRVESHLRFSQGGMATRQILKYVSNWTESELVNQLRIQVMENLKESLKKSESCVELDSNLLDSTSKHNLPGSECWTGPTWDNKWDSKNLMMFTRTSKDVGSFLRDAEPVLVKQSLQH